MSHSRWHGGTLGFPDESQRFLHGALTELLGKLASLEGTHRKAVEERLAWARRISDLTLGHPKARATWQQARDAIAKADGVVASELYRAGPVDLQPQMGLVPIGMNPVTRLWEFYELRSAWDQTVDPAEIEIPRHVEAGERVGDIEVDAGTGIVFVLLPGGSFTMGSQRSQPDAPGYDPEGSEDSGPPHQVHLAPFFLARHEATQGQWRRLTGQTPSHYPAAANVAGRSITWSHPVEQVDWHDCARWLTQHGLALPTEAQWEYGCRAGTTTPWWTGADRETLRGVANLADQSAGRAGAPWADIADWPDLDDGFAVHAPVDALRPNAFGMHHVHGNVWEWCRDVRVAYSVPARPGDGARGVEPGPLRVVRGGGFINAARGARSGDRGDGTATMRMNALGVRPARELIGPQQTSSSR